MEFNLENTKGFPLSDALQEDILRQQHECTMTWSTSDGWPMGMLQLFLWKNGSIWTSTSVHKARVKALQARPHSCIVVSGLGTAAGADRTVVLKTEVVFHQPAEEGSWYYPEMARKMYPDSPEQAQLFQQLLDSSGRIIIQHKPIKRITYDGQSMAVDLLSRMGVE